MHLIKYLKKFIYDRIPSKDLHGFEYTVNELVGMWENSNWAVKNWHGQMLNDDIIKYKKSDTIFILGSGPSINDITADQWNIIANNDTIGFNYWFAHSFVPTYYVFQAGFDNMLNILKEKHQHYKSVPFIIRGSRFAKGEFNFNDERLNLLKNNPVYFLNEYPIAGRCSIEPNALFKYIEALGFMTYKSIPGFIPKWRSTLGLLVMLSYHIGYKNIVLCGMDMQKPDHFWDYPPYIDLKHKYQLPDIGSANLNLFTDNKRINNTVPKYIYKLNEWMRNKSDVNIYLVNRRTVLYPIIPLYSFR